MTDTQMTANRSIRQWFVRAFRPAGIGAGVTVLVSLVPFIGLLAPAIGGGVASRVGASAGTDGPGVGLLAGAMVVLLSLPVTFLAVAGAATISPIATIGVLAMTLFGAAYVVGSSALGGYVADTVGAGGKRSTSPAATERRSDTTAVEGEKVRGTTTAEPPVERLKRRYVDGEIDDAEFERRMEQLMATERSRELEFDDAPGSRNS